MQKKGFIHRNITPESILVNTSSRKVKLGGFYYATYLKPNSFGKKKEAPTSHLYMSPEVLSLKHLRKTQIAVDRYSHGMDIWALGITLLELITGHPPHYQEYTSGFESESQQDVIEKIIEF